MRFSAGFPVEVSVTGATPMAAAACRSCSAGIGGGCEVPGVSVQNATASRDSGQLCR